MRRSEFAVTTLALSLSALWAVGCTGSQGAVTTSAEAAVMVDASTQADSDRATEILTPVPLPTPPQQGAPWSVPTGDLELSRLGESAQLLFAQDLADPRGAEYRAVTIWAGSVWNDGSEVDPPVRPLRHAAGPTRRSA